MWKALHLILLVVTAIASKNSNDTAEVETTNTPSFDIDYENDQFLLDGKPFRYVSGSFHYFRTPKLYWRDRLRKMRTAGLNAVSTYVEWSLHEPEPGKWNWNGEADLSEFLKIAQEEDLLVLLRPGPYICAERDFGGFPTWLLSILPDIELRTNDSRYMAYVEKYLKEVLTRVNPYLRGNGGPIIMVQVENEYGSFNACDVQYRSTLKTIFNQYIESKAVLYTTDGPLDNMLRCGFIPGVFATVDFGTSGNATKNFEKMRQFQPRGPLVNSEFYPGWLTHWEEPFQKVSTIQVVKALDELLAMGASVNIYMFYGGTNFGFTAGANTDPEYRPQLTSYDYDAPLTEAGDPTPKYFAIRDVIANYISLPDLPIPTISPKKDYGTLVLEPIIRLFDPLARTLLSSVTVQRKTPPNFEEIIQLPLQLVLYETDLPTIYENPSILEAVVHDRAYVYTDLLLTGTLSRSHKRYSIPLKNYTRPHLALLVENQGHINYGNYIRDFKGLWNVTVNKNELSMWNVTAFPLDNIKPIRAIVNTSSFEFENLYGGPVFFRGHFNIEGAPADTFLDTTGWGKGVAYINDNNLGRYWPLAGPQNTLYVPSSFLKEGYNELIILELQYVSKPRSMKFQSTPHYTR